MNILNWFDINNIEHLKAYEYLQEKGFWPDGFLLEDITFVTSWQVVLANRFADRYVEEKLKEFDCKQFKELEKDIYSLLTEGRKIDAIKHIRKVSGLDFQSAKEAIIGYQRRMDIAKRYSDDR